MIEKVIQLYTPIMIKKFTDNRGDFVLFDSNKCDQVNVVTNPKGFTFRGMHYQEGDSAQRKTIKIIQGKVIDFLYDIDKKQTEVYFLDENSEPLVVDKKYAHGYLTLEENTIFTYAVEGDYNPEKEKIIRWEDVPRIKEILTEYISGYGELIISDKDKNGK
jgi:dTDP-4-dehydrorhamnose 3,5-epimerase